MITTIDSGERKARKAHRCDAWDIYLDGLGGLKFCGGIKKGDVYEFQTNTRQYDGIWTFRTCLKCSNSAKKHNIELYDT